MRDAVYLVNPNTGEPLQVDSEGRLVATTTTEAPIAVPEDIDATGTPSATTFLRGDGAWVVPTDTTYAAIEQADAEDPESTDAGLVTGQRIAEGVEAFLAAITGYDALEIQTLKNDAGTLTWVTDA